MKPLAILRRYPRRIAAGALGVALLAGMGWIRLGSIPADLLDDRGSSSTVVVDRNGLPLYEALSTEGTRSVKLSANDLPATLVAATLAV